MTNRNYRNIVSLILLAVLVIAACTKPDRSEEADRVTDKVKELTFKNPDQTLVRVDSAEQVGLFLAAAANVIRANVYRQMGQTRLAIFYGEQRLMLCQTNISKATFETRPVPPIFFSYRENS